MQSCLGKGRVYHLKCEAFLNLSQMLFYSHSPITLHKMEKPIMTKIGHSNSSWHTNTQWKSLEIKTAYLPLCLKHTRDRSRSKIRQGVLPFTRNTRESSRQNSVRGSQRTLKLDRDVQTHHPPQEGAHPKGVKGHPALYVHRKSKSLSKRVKNIFITRGCC